MKKGKDHKPTEFGTKASVVATAKSNIHAAHTLVVVLEETHKRRLNNIVS